MTRTSQDGQRRSVVATVAATVVGVGVLALLWVLVLAPLVRAVTWIMVVIALLSVAGRYALLRREGRGGMGVLGDVRRLALAATSGITWLPLLLAAAVLRPGPLRSAYAGLGLVLLAGWLVAHRRALLTRVGRRRLR